MKVKVFAKLNLTLNVGAKQGNMHPIDSVVTSVNVFDVVQVTVRHDNAVTVSGVDGVDIQRNSAYRIATLFCRYFGCNGVDISIIKGIPMGAGMGGSSADASATVYCMCKLFGVSLTSPKVQQICSQVGSDVYYMLFGGLATMIGATQGVTPYALPQPLYFALTTFGTSCNTAQVFATFDTVGNNGVYANNKQLLQCLVAGNYADALPRFCNALQLSAYTLDGFAQRYNAFVHQKGWHGAMTGSGSAHFIAFDNATDAQNAVDALQSNGFSTALCQTVPSGIEQMAE